MSGSVGRFGGMGIGALSTTGVNLLAPADEGPVVGPAADPTISPFQNVRPSAPLRFNPLTVRPHAFNPLRISSRSILGRLP